MTNHFNTTIYRILLLALILGGLFVSLFFGTGIKTVQAAAITSGNVYVDTDNGTNNATCGLTSGAGACKSLAYVFSNRANTTLTGALNVYAVGATDDTTTFSLYQSIYTTTSSNYIAIHGNWTSGKYDPTKYHLTATNVGDLIAIRADYVYLDGLQLLKTGTNLAGYSDIEIFGQSVANEIRISNSLLVEDRNSSYYGFNIAIGDADAIVHIWNIVAYGAGTYNGTNSAINITLASAVSIYSSTISGGAIGIRNTSASTVTAKNVYVQSATAFSGTIAKTNCASSDATADGTSPKINVAYSTANFVNTTVGSEDLELSAGSALIDVGANTTGDPAPMNFATDATGATRTGTWDIGAFEYNSGGTPTSDTTPPTVSITSPTAGATVSGSISVTASASDNVGVAGVQFKLDGANLGAEDTTSPYTITWDTTTATNAAHTLTATARDAAGNIATATNVAVTVSNAAPDTAAPSVPTGLTATAISSSQINLSWTASTDNVAVTGYKIYRGGTQIATSATTSYSDTGLTASTPYSYTVSAYDAAGNNSAQSTAASATTQAASAKRVDLLNSSGTVLNTYTTIQACANVVTAGQTCLVYPALYDERVTPVNSGTVGNVITYKAVTDCVSNNGATIAASCPKVRGFTAVSKNYITIEGLEFTTQGMSKDGVRVISFTTSDHITVLNNYVHDTDAPFACVNAGVQSTNIIFRGNNIKLCGEAMDVYATIRGPYNIQAGVNDKISFSVQGGAAQTATLTAGVARSAAQIASDVNTQLGGGSSGPFWAIGGPNNSFSIRSITFGPTSSLEVLSVANSVYATMGMSLGLGTMTGHDAAFGGTGATPPAVTDWLIENNVLSYLGDYLTPGSGSRLVYRNNQLGPSGIYNNDHIDVIQQYGFSQGLLEGNLSIDNNNSDNHFYLNQGSGDHFIARFNSTCRSAGGVAQGGYPSPVPNHLYFYNNTFYDNFAYMYGNHGGQMGAYYSPNDNVSRNNIWYKSLDTLDQIYYTVNGATIARDYDMWYGMGNPSEPNGKNADPLVVGGSSDCNFNLQSTSPAIDTGGLLTAVSSTDSGTGTTLVVSDAHFFQDGWAGVSPDCIAVGTTANTACIAVSGINYATNVITLTSAISRTPGQPVYLFKNSSGVQVLYGTAPDIGAYEYVVSTPSPTPTPTPADTTPPVISAINSSAITSSAATITWTTDEISDSQVEYGTTTSYGASTTLSTSLVTAHSVNLSALTANTLYHYRVKSKDAAGNLATSADNTFTTLANPPVISNIQATSIGATSATITWTTDKPSSSKVNYGLTSSYTTSTVKDTTLVTTHSVTLGNLNSSTIYHYQVESTDSGSLTTLSSDNTFTTTAPLSLPVISNIQSTNITTSGATITWTTDISSDSQVEYGLTTSYGTSTTLNSTLVTSHSVLLSGLNSGTTYNYRVKSGGSVSINKTFSTPSLGADTTPPSAVTNLTATGSTATSINLSWTAPGNDGNTGTAASYQMRWYVLPITDSNWNTAIVLTGLPTPTSAGTTQTYSAIGLTANTTYYFALKTSDASGNISALSNVPSIKTQTYTASAAAGSNSSAGSADTTPPNPPKLSRLVEADSQVLLEWVNPSDTDFARVVIIERDNRFPASATDGVDLLETDKTSYTVSNLKNGQTYYFAIFAIDTAKNYSTPLLIKAVPKEGVLSFSNQAPPNAAASTTAYIPPVTSTPSTPGQFTSPYVSGTLLRYLFGQEVYYLENKIKRHISDYATLLKLTHNDPQKVIITPFKDALSDYADGQPITGKDTSQINISPTLIRSKDSPQVYLIDEQSKTRKPIPTLAIFYSYGFSFNQVDIVDKTALDQYTDAASISFQLLPDSSLIKSKAEPKIYIIQNSQKRWLTTYNIFKAYKFNLNDVITLDNSVIAAYPNGQDVATTTESFHPAPISEEIGVEQILHPAPIVIGAGQGTLIKGSAPTLYYIESNQKRAFSSLAVFELLGYKQSNVKTIKDADLKLIPDGTAISSIQTHPNGTLVKLADDYRIYLIENGKIRHISSPDVFNAKGYSMDKVVTVSPQELGGYEAGEEVSSP